MDFKRSQKVQYQHDLQNHFDILSMSRIDRLKHYGLHFAKYAGRLARGKLDPKPQTQTLVDAFLVSLSSANALNQLLNPDVPKQAQIDDFVDYAGLFADACEKIDHLEDFRSQALHANASIMGWIVASSSTCDLNLETTASERRLELSKRAVYAPGN